MKEIIKMAEIINLEFFIIQMEIFMRECGRTIKYRDKENSNGKTVTDMKEIFKMA